MIQGFKVFDQSFQRILRDHMFPGVGAHRPAQFIVLRQKDERTGQLAFSEGTRIPFAVRPQPGGTAP